VSHEQGCHQNRVKLK